jgi:beta-glucosidase
MFPANIWIKNRYSPVLTPIAVVGITSDLEGEEMDVAVPGFKGGDRTSLDLPKEEEDPLKAVKNTGKPLVVVLMSGSALAVGPRLPSPWPE